MAVYYKELTNGSRMYHLDSYFGTGGYTYEDFHANLSYNGGGVLNLLDGPDGDGTGDLVYGYGYPTIEEPDYRTSIRNQLFTISGGFIYSVIYRSGMFFHLGDIPKGPHEIFTSIQLKFILHYNNSLPISLVKSRLEDTSSIVGSGWDHSNDNNDYGYWGTPAALDDPSTSSNAFHIDEYGSDDFIPYLGPVPGDTEDSYLLYGQNLSNNALGTTVTLNLNSTAVRDANRDGYLNIGILGLNDFSAIYLNELDPSLITGGPVATGIRWAPAEFDPARPKVPNTDFYGAVGSYNIVGGTDSQKPSLRITTGTNYQDSFKGKIYSTYIYGSGEILGTGIQKIRNSRRW